MVLNGIPEVDDQLLASLTCCPQLQRLSLCNCAAVTDAGVEAAAKALPGLREFRLDDCTKARAGAAVAALLRLCGTPALHTAAGGSSLCLFHVFAVALWQ